MDKPQEKGNIRKNNQKTKQNRCQDLIKQCIINLLHVLYNRYRLYYL